MVLRSKRRFTNIFVLEDLNDFSEMKQMDIFYEVSIKINYCYQDYKNDQKRINTFLEFGNRENLKKYLEFAENVVNSNFEEMNEYWLLFASAKFMSLLKSSSLKTIIQCIRFFFLVYICILQLIEFQFLKIFFWIVGFI